MPGFSRKTFSRRGRGDSQVVGGRWSNGMYVSPFRLLNNRPDGPKIGAQIPVARITLAKAAIWGDSRDCEISKFPGFDRYAARLPGGLFIFGLLYSVIGGGAGRFWPRNVNRAGIPGISRAGIFEGFHTFVCSDVTRGRLGETWQGCGPMARLCEGYASNSDGCGSSGRGSSQAETRNSAAVMLPIPIT